jgi:hypothetical protein
VVGDPLFEPKSEEEARWLTRYGYPTAEDLAALSHARPTASALDASDGFSPAEILAASELAVVAPDQTDLAKDFLNEAAINGSIFALQQMGGLLNHPLLQDPVLSEAYFRASVLRGDWSAHFRASMNNLSRENDLRANLLAHQIIADINQERLRRGLSPLYPDPRPGLEGLLQKMDAASQSDDQ